MDVLLAIQLSINNVTQVKASKLVCNCYQGFNSLLYVFLRVMTDLAL